MSGKLGVFLLPIEVSPYFIGKRVPLQRANGLPGGRPEGNILYLFSIACKGIFGQTDTHNCELGVVRQELLGVLLKELAADLNLVLIPFFPLGFPDCRQPLGFNQYEAIGRGNSHVDLRASWVQFVGMGNSPPQEDLSYFWSEHQAA